MSASGLVSGSSFLARLRESDHPFQGWLPASTLVMDAGTGVAAAASDEALAPSVAGEAIWIGAGEFPFVFLFATADQIPGAACAPAERELWEKMIGALGFAPGQARLGTLGAWSEGCVAGAVPVAVGVLAQDARTAGVVHVLPALADLVRDASLKRPAWKTLQDAAAEVGWKIPAPRGAR